MTIIASNIHKRMHFKCVCVWQRLDNDNDAETMRTCADFIQPKYCLHTFMTEIETVYVRVLYAQCLLAA